MLAVSLMQGFSGNRPIRKSSKHHQPRLTSVYLPTVDEPPASPCPTNPTKRPTPLPRGIPHHGQLQRPQPRQHPAHLLLAARNPLGRRRRQPGNPVCPLRLRTNLPTAPQRPGPTQRCRQTTTATVPSPGPQRPGPAHRPRQTTTATTTLPSPTSPKPKPCHPNTASPNSPRPHPPPPPRPNHGQLHVPLPRLHQRRHCCRSRPATLPPLPRRPRLRPPHAPQHALSDVPSPACLAAPVV